MSAPLKRFEIVLNNGGVFTPGTEVSGKLILEAAEQFPYEQVGLSVVGKAETDFQNKTHKDSLQLLDEGVRLQQVDYSINGNIDASLLKPGIEYVFQFAYKLPRNAPPSFLHDKGQIVYRCNAVVRRGSNQVDLIKTKFFRVLPLVPLSDYTVAEHPFFCHDTQPLSIGCLPYGSIKVYLQLAKTGFLRSEPIKLNYDVTNQSRGRKLTAIYFRMEQYFYFRAGIKQRTITESKTLFEFKHDLDLSFSESTGLRAVSLKWPASISELENPPTLLNCQIITVQYRLFVNIQNDSLYSKVCYTYMLPILIGTVA